MRHLPVYLVLFLLLSFTCGFVHAQQLTAVVKGRVTDKESKQPLTGANVFVINSNPPQGATTDEDGNFRIENVTVGRHSFKITYLGYDDRTMNEIMVTSGREVNLNIEMQEKINNLGEVEITAGKDKAKAHNEFGTVSIRTISAEEMTRYAGTQNDPARLAQSFAGVVSSGDDNNQIVVRGNSPRGLLWRMEGVEIPNPNHFAGSEGSTGGGVSMLSANMLTNTDFFSGAFPAEYGNALSGVFDLNLRKGNSDRHEFAFQAGVLGLEAALEGPFSKKYRGSFLINYRYSTLDILDLIGFKVAGNQVPKYQDLTFNFYLPTKKAGAFTFFGLGGISSLGGKAARDTSLWKYQSDRMDYNLSQKMGVTGITHTYLLKDNKTYIKTVLSYSYTNNGDTNDTLDGDFNKFNISNEQYTYRIFRGTVVINTKLDAKNTVRSGIIASHINYGLSNDAFNYYTGQYQNFVNSTGHTQLYQAYVQWRHRFTEKLQVSSGMHLLFSQINNKLYLEPRINGEYLINEKHSLSFGAGLHSRTDAVSTYISYTAGNSSNRKLDFSRALHGIVGYNFTFLKDFHLKLEAYAQYLFAVPIGADSANATFSILNYNDGLVSIPLSSKGTGYNYGLELTFEKFFSRHYFFMLTASVFQSQYKAGDGVWRNTAYNANYVLNALGSKEFVVGKKKNNAISINARLTWRGGQYTTPIDLPQSIAANESRYINNKAFSQKLPDYFRIDFGVNFKRNKKKYAWTLAFDAQNIINRQNVAAIAYDADKQAIVTYKNLGIIPVMSWKIEFSTK